MCLAVLMLDRDYTCPRPRRPEGGPDGGRDADVRWRGIECFVAVGFQNNVSDSTENKRQAKAKFRSDLKAALKKKPDLKAFVFFTNVDLTPGEQEKLEEFAAERGVTHPDIYNRERMREALDRPEGFAIRHEYLRLKMSDADQASFFSRFGRDLEELVTQRFRSVESQLEALKFHLWQSRPLRDLTLQVRLKSPVTAGQLGHFRVFLELEGASDEWRNWSLGGRDDYSTTDTASGPKLLFGVATFWCTQLAPDASPSLLAATFRGPHTRSLYVASEWPSGCPFTPEQLDGLWVRLFVTENMVGLAETVALHSGPYTLLRFSVAGHPVRACHPDRAWPEKLTEEEKRLGWVLYEYGKDWPPQVLDFARTPARRNETGRVEA
jgi:hypothetical protein